LKINMKKTIKIVLLILILSYSVIMLIIISKHRKNNFCHKINIVIKDSLEYQLVNSKEILKFLFDNEFQILGKPIFRIETSKIEEELEKFPEVKNATVYITDNGILNIEIVQFKPILIILDSTNQKHYIDIDGNILHSKKATPRNTLFINGCIPAITKNYKNVKELNENKKLKIINDIYTLSKYIYNDEFWKAQIQQIYLNYNNEFELIPRVGPHIIIFGDIKNYEEKFENLFLFYQEALNKIGWNNYKYINLKFKNQIVCTKN